MGHCPRILVCEHDDALREQLTRKFETNGFWADHAGSAREALAKLEQHPYDAMTLGLILSDQDSLSFLHDLNVLGIRLPILVTSVRNGRKASGSMLEVELEPAMEEPEPEWVRKAASQARIIFAVKCACQRSRSYRPRILHVEPDPFSAGLVHAALAKSVELTQAADLNALEDALCQGPFDLIVLNPDLGEGAGEAALHRVAGACPEVPIILHAQYSIRYDEADLWPEHCPSPEGQVGLIQALRNLVLHSADIPQCAQA